MPRRTSLALLALLAACSSTTDPDPEPTIDALAPVAPSVPSQPTASADVRFPNAPLEGGWLTLGTLDWAQSVPFRQDPVYEGDNGSHLVDYGDDDPAVVWGRQSAIVTDSGAPGAHALESRLPVGLTGGSGATKIGQHPDWRDNGPLLWDPALSTGHLYVGVYLRFSPHFRLNGNVGQKVLYLKSDLPQNRELNHMPVILVNDGNRGDQLWPAYEPQHPFGKMQVASTGANDLNDGRWHLVEILQSPNTPGQANGQLRIWVDGRDAGSWNDAMFFEDGQVASVNRLEINPIYGGGTNPVPANAWVRVGAMHVAIR